MRNEFKFNRLNVDFELKKVLLTKNFFVEQLNSNYVAVRPTKYNTEITLLRNQIICKNIISYKKFLVIVCCYCKTT